MSVLLVALSLLVFHVVYFDVVNSSMYSVRSVRVYAIITGLVNAVICALIFMYARDVGEHIHFGIFLLLYSVELAYICRRPLTLAFCVLLGALMVESLRMLMIVIAAETLQTNLHGMYDNERVICAIWSISFFVSASYALVLKRFVGMGAVDMIFTDRHNVLFSVGMFGFLTLYTLFVASMIGKPEVGGSLELMYGVIALTVSGACQLAMVFSYAFGKLRLYVEKYETVRDLIEQESESIKELTHIVEHDEMTGVRMREQGVIEIERRLNEGGNFYVVFIDLDELKTVNDNYGHTEGDFYIRHVAECIKSTFKTEVVARMGGDEFLVVGKSADPYEAMRKTMQSYEKVKFLKREHDKPYSTSVSYGIVEYRGANIAVEDIIAEADARMYEFKRRRRKERGRV